MINESKLNQTLPKRIQGVTLYHIIQYLNEKFKIELDVMFAIPEGDKSIYFHDPKSGSVAIFACFTDSRPKLVFFCMKSQIFLQLAVAELHAELIYKFPELSEVSKPDKSSGPEVSLQLVPLPFPWSGK